MRSRWKRGRGPSKGWRALEALAKACAGLSLIVVLTHALSAEGINPANPTHVLASVLFVAFAWIGIKSARTARRIERDPHPPRTAHPREPAATDALPPPTRPAALAHRNDTAETAKPLSGPSDTTPVSRRRIARLLRSLFHVK